MRGLFLVDLKIKEKHLKRTFHFKKFIFLRTYLNFFGQHLFLLPLSQASSYLAKLKFSSP